MCLLFEKKGNINIKPCDFQKRVQQCIHGVRAWRHNYSEGAANRRPTVAPTVAGMHDTGDRTYFAAGTTRHHGDGCLEMKSCSDTVRLACLHLFKITTKYFLVMFAVGTAVSKLYDVFDRYDSHKWLENVLDEKCIDWAKVSTSSHRITPSLFHLPKIFLIFKKNP